MGSVLTTLGAQTYNSFTSYGAGTDYVSGYDPADDYAAPVTGAIGDSYSVPIMFRYLQIYNGSTSTGSRDLQISTANTGGGGAQSSAIAGSDNDPDWNVTDSAAFGPLQFATTSRNSDNSKNRFYYGFYKNDASTVYFYTGVSPNTAYNPTDIFRNGTVDTAYSGRVISGRIGWYHVPNAPTSPVQETTTSSSIAFRWTHPTDDGITDSLSFGGLYGYRIAYKASSSGTWLVYGSETSASPSGCDYIQGTSPYNYTTTPSPTTPSSGTPFTRTGAYENVTGLTSNTTYNFKIAGLNLVTDRHNGSAVSIVTTSPTTGTRSYGNYTSTAAHVGTNLDVSYTTKLATPTLSGSLTSTGNVNAPYSASVTITQPKGGGVNTSYTQTITTASGSLPAGLTYSTSVTSDATNSYTTVTLSGTPTTPGVYNFTTRATNADGYYITSSTQTITITALGPKVSPTDGTAPTARAIAKVWNGTSFVTAEMKVYDGTTPYDPNGWKYLK